MLIAPTPTWRSDLHFLVGKVLQGLGQDLGRAGHVGLDDQRQLLDAAFLDLVEELIERKLLAGGHRLLALPELAERGDRARFRFVRNDLERVARLREILEAGDLDRSRGTRVRQPLAAVVAHRADPPENRSREKDVSHVQRPGLDEHRRHVAAPRFAPRFENHAPGLLGDRSGQLLQVRDDQDQLEQLVDPLLADRRDFRGGNLASPRLQQHAMVRELFADAVGVRVRLVDLVDRDDDRNLRRPRVVDRLDGLRHHAVISRDDEDHDVRGPGSPGAHRGERLVTGGVEEDDGAVVHFDPISTDVLGDPPGLSFGDLGLADGVQERRLSMIDVAHDRHDRRAGGPGRCGDRSDFRGFRGGPRELELLFERNDGRFDPDFLRDLDGGRGIERLVHGREDSPLHEQPLDVFREHTELLGQLLDGDPFRQEDRSGRHRFLELEQLARVVRARGLRGAPQSRLGNRLRLRHDLGFFGAFALLDERKGDVRIRVFFVSADELPQIDFVRDRDLRLRAALRGRLLRLLFVFLLAFRGRAVRERRRGCRAAETQPGPSAGTGTPGGSGRPQRRAGRPHSGAARSRPIHRRSTPPRRALPATGHPARR